MILSEFARNCRVIEKPTEL